ncbi:MAG: Rieske (2Fe-2S) protein, partial [Pseudomonadota bacterium]
AGAAGAAAGAAAGHAAGAAAGRAAGAAAASDAWLAVPGADAVAEGRALIVAMPDGRRAAVFRQEGTLAALSNACAHQNGPLGEGRILDGCVTCPWHGFQYRLVDGRSPPPFTERVPTYNLRRSAEGTVEIRVRANPPGTATQPIAALPPDAGSGPAGMVQGAPA